LQIVPHYLSVNHFFFAKGEEPIFFFLQRNRSFPFSLVSPVSNFWTANAKLMSMTSPSKKMWKEKKRWFLSFQTFSFKLVHFEEEMSGNQTNAFRSNLIDLSLHE